MFPCLSLFCLFRFTLKYMEFFEWIDLVQPCICILFLTPCSGSYIHKSYSISCAPSAKRARKILATKAARRRAGEGEGASGTALLARKIKTRSEAVLPLAAAVTRMPMILKPSPSAIMRMRRRR